MSAKDDWRKEKNRKHAYTRSEKLKRANQLGIGVSGSARTQAGRSRAHQCVVRLQPQPVAQPDCGTDVQGASGDRRALGRYQSERTAPYFPCGHRLGRRDFGAESQFLLPYRNKRQCCFVEPKERFQLRCPFPASLDNFSGNPIIGCVGVQELLVRRCGQ